MAATAGFMTHVTRRLSAKNRDQLRNPTLCNRVWATYTFFNLQEAAMGEDVACVECCRQSRDLLQWTEGLQQHKSSSREHFCSYDIK